MQHQVILPPQEIRKVLAWKQVSLVSTPTPVQERIQLGEPAIIPAGIESDHAKDGPPSIAMTLG